MAKAEAESCSHHVLPTCTPLSLSPPPIQNICAFCPQFTSAIAKLSQDCLSCCSITSCCSAISVDTCVEEVCALADGVADSLCADCLVQCDEQDCKMAQNSDNCTDICLVVPCIDPITPQSDCVDCFSGCTDSTCSAKPCTGGKDCPGTFEELLQCCTDYHAYAENSLHVGDVPDQLFWRTAFESLLSPPSTSAPQGTFPHPAPAMRPNTFELDPTAEQTEAMDAFLQGYPSLIPYAATTRSTGAMSPLHNQSYNSDFQNSDPLQLQSPTSSQNSSGYVCLWANCRASYPSLSELVGHVNLVHLHPTNMNNSQPQLAFANQTLNNVHNNTSREKAVSCLWDDCHAFPDSSAIPSSSTTLEADAAFNLLSSHFLQDHLGLPTPFFPVLTSAPTSDMHADTSSSVSSAPSLTSGVSMDTTEDNHSGVMTPPSSSASPAPPQDHEHDCTLPHACRWRGCGRQFSSCDLLTVHLTQQHVGAGKSHYICQWEGCHRDGEQGFTSKQKILRHLQSHTGHRPFQCEMCGQNFSEAATLQQHMRRHTQEKPYVCDFPGCNKAFAITGALTIHKRTHNGDKPFKCTYCDRAFAESSNLSKHLRTHTGVRPYPCTVASCEKSFARPDQLARHLNVHTKKGQVASS